jgi:hypothetical protein
MNDTTYNSGNTILCNGKGVTGIIRPTAAPIPAREYVVAPYIRQQ